MNPGKYWKKSVLFTMFTMFTSGWRSDRTNVTNQRDTTSCSQHWATFIWPTHHLLTVRTAVQKNCCQFGFTKDEALLLLCDQPQLPCRPVTTLTLKDPSQSHTEHHVVAVLLLKAFNQQDHPFNSECPWLTEWVVVLCWATVYPAALLSLEPQVDTGALTVHLASLPSGPIDCFHYIPCIFY